MAVNVMSRQLLLRILVGCVCCAAASCASAPPIPLRASPSSLQALVGEWDGTYTSRDTGRSGSLWFKLIAGEDHAHGDVLMTPRGRTDSYHRYPPSGWPSTGRPTGLTEVLAIQFAHAADGTVDGRLEPYLGSGVPMRSRDDLSRPAARRSNRRNVQHTARRHRSGERTVGRVSQTSGVTPDSGGPS